jgi:hypothetical protein
MRKFEKPYAPALAGDGKPPVGEQASALPTAAGVRVSVVVPAPNALRNLAYVFVGYRLTCTNATRSSAAS